MEHPPTNSTSSGLLALPDELLLAVLALCDPECLLQITRVCSSTRNLLLSPTSEQIWTSSRANYPPIKCRKTQMFPFGVSFTNEVEVPLPDRFDNISEPAFARLMFEEACSACSSRRGTPYTALQKRLCNLCREKHCIPRSQLQEVSKEYSTSLPLDENETNAWLASVRLHCARQQDSRHEDLYWLEDVQRHAAIAIEAGRVTKVYLDPEEAEAMKDNERFEKQWREWLEANRVVNEGQSDARLAGSTGINSLT